MQGQVWFETIAWPGPGPVCTFSCLYISDLAEFYYSRVFCACANPAPNRITDDTFLANDMGADGSNVTRLVG